jgi:uncharacterized protein YjbI with pentapeptide repeats
MTDTLVKSANLQGVTCTGARLVRTNFAWSDLTGVSFEGQTLSGVIFNGCSLKNAVFKDAVLREVTFRHSAAKHADFGGAKMDKITFALLKSSKAKLDNVTVL